MDFLSKTLFFYQQICCVTYLAHHYLFRFCTGCRCGGGFYCISYPRTKPLACAAISVLCYDMVWSILCVGRRVISKHWHWSYLHLSRQVCLNIHSFWIGVSILSGRMSQTSIPELLSTPLWAHISISRLHRADRNKPWNGSLHYTPFRLSFAIIFKGSNLGKFQLWAEWVSD